MILESTQFKSIISSKSFGYYQKEALKMYNVLYGSNCLQQRNEDLCTEAPEMGMSRIIRAQYGRFFHEKCSMADFALIELESTIEETVANYICLGYRNIIREEDQHLLMARSWQIIYN